MSSATLIPVEEYLRTTYRPDRDYLEGALVERNVGERDHSELQGALTAYLFSRRKQWHIVVLPEQRVQVKPRRFRIPDVCVLSESDPNQPIVRTPPLVCVEILSREDSMLDMQDRIDDYLGFGVPCVWVLNPRTRKAYICTPARWWRPRMPSCECPELRSQCRSAASSSCKPDFTKTLQAVNDFSNPGP